jgi:DNA ligase (NAD+)
MDIEGFSESTAKLLIEMGRVKEFSDLYRLKAEDLADLEGFKEKKVNNLLTAIEKSKQVALDAFIFAIGVDGIGRVAAKDLAKRFKSMDGLQNATVEELVSLENVGEITANNIVAYFARESNRAELTALAEQGVNPTWEEEVKTGIFTGENVVLTGTLQGYKRSAAQKMIEERGGACQSSVTKTTTLVVAGEEAGSKLDKAKKLGIRVIDEAEFTAMLKQN